MKTISLQTKDIKELDVVFWKCHNVLRNNERLNPIESFKQFIAILLAYKLNNLPLEKINRDILNQSLKEFYLKKFKNLKNSKIFESLYIRVNNETLKLIINLLEDMKTQIKENEILSIALNSYLNKDLRKSFGIFPTPHQVIDFTLKLVDIPKGSIILDPAVGTGIFLTEILKKYRDIKVIGIDLDPLMLLITLLNTSLYTNPENILLILNDFLLEEDTILKLATHIFTNPPYGLKVSKDKYKNFISFQLCKRDLLPLEVLFLEKMIKTSNPNTRFAILIPNSILTNKIYENFRKYFGNFIEITGLIQFPAELFDKDEINQETSLLIFHKIGNKKLDKNLPKFKVKLKNLKYIMVDEIIENIHNTKSVSNKYFSIEIYDSLTFDKINLPKNINVYISKRNISIREVADIHKNSFLRKKYEPIENLFNENYSNNSNNYFYVIKVGNLRDFYPDFSNFNKHIIEINETSKTIKCLKQFDILTTATAHRPKYICEKVNFLIKKPLNFFDLISSPEILIIRPKKEKINPLVLYAYMLLPSTKETLRSLVRGSTAHLYPVDVLNYFYIPSKLLDISENIDKYEEFFQLQELILAEAEANIMKAKNKFKLLSKLDKLLQ